MVMTDTRINQPLGRIAELLVENNARVRLIEIRDLLEGLDEQAYAEGFADGERRAGDGDDSLALPFLRSRPQRGLTRAVFPRCGARSHGFLKTGFRLGNPRGFPVPTRVF